MNVSEENIPLQTMLDVARSQPDYNHAFPILEVIQTHYMGSPYANEVVKLVNEVKASFRKPGIGINASPASSQNMPSRGGRPKRAGTVISKAFIYEGAKDHSARLMMLCEGMRALGWIHSDTDVQVFIDIFSGGEIRQRSIWTGDANTLATLFKRLVNERGLVSLPEKHSLWVMVSGHFWDKERGKTFETDKLRNTHVPKENDQTIAYLVNILDTEYSMDEIREMIASQR